MQRHDPTSLPPYLRGSSRPAPDDPDNVSISGIGVTGSSNGPQCRTDVCAPAEICAREDFNLTTAVESGLFLLDT